MSPRARLIFGSALAGVLSACGSLSDSTSDSQRMKIDFTRSDLFDRTASGADPGIWNFDLGRIQAGIGPADDITKIINFGDGTDGDFNNGPAQTGISVSGSTITIDTSVKATYNFRSFNLDSGFAVQLTGSSPLRIRSLGAVRIAGSISADGTTGSPNDASLAVAGGAGGTGGGTGGSGSSSAANNATNGQPYVAGNPAPAPQGGDAGATVTSTTPRGGNGGCNGQDSGANDATQGANNPASLRCTSLTYAGVATAFDTAFTGGGGGGGGCRDLAASPGGAPGGGGGGAIQIAAAGSITISGTLSVRGGAGGPNSTNNLGVCAGGGGGGSGGSVWLQTASSTAGSGSVDLRGGAGGVDPGPTCAAFGGGDGSRGVLRIDRSSGTLATLPASAGATTNSVVAVTTKTYTVVSKSIPNTGKNLHSLDAAIETDTDVSSVGCGSAGTTTVTYQGSNDGTTWSAAVAAASVPQLSDYAYLRFTVTLNATAGVPPCLKSITIPYLPKEISDVELKGGGLSCGSTSSRSSRSGGGDPLAPFSALGDALVALAALALARIERIARASSRERAHRA